MANEEIKEFLNLLYGYYYLQYRGIEQRAYIEFRPILRREGKPIVKQKFFNLVDFMDNPEKYLEELSSSEH